MPKIAISADFLTAFSLIPKAQQKKVREFAEKFQFDPKQSSINYEPVRSAVDSKVRTVRIGVDYRAVVIHPQTGDVYILVWVDHHDEAMDWAKKKLFDINKETGSLQIIDMTFVKTNLQTNNKVSDVSKFPKKGIPQVGLFDNVVDKDLQLIGVPGILFPAIRSLITEKDLDDIQPYIPVEVYEGLFMLAAGFSLEETIEELRRAAKVEKPGEDDFANALENPDSQRRFRIVKSIDELTEMLDQPLEKWRVFLHPNQIQLVKGNYKGPVYVRGGAGTGKTVVAMHRAQYLAENICKKLNEKVLFTTFTKNLAQSIFENMSKLCSPKTLSQIEIVNLHSWAMHYLRSNGIMVNVADNNTLLDCWKKAIEMGKGEFELNFYREEWEQIIVTHSISDLSNYLRISRIGRGTRLTRLQRINVWTIIDNYRCNLLNKGVVEWIDVIRQARLHLEKENISLPYRSVVVDESQDLHPEEFKLIRTIISEKDNDIFLVGDAHQRIYGRKAILGQCGINVRGSRSKRLKVNYRTTEEIRRWAVNLLEGELIDDLDGEVEDQTAYRSLLRGQQPIIKNFLSNDDEISYIAAYLIQRKAAGIPLENICITARTSNLIDRTYLPALEAMGIKCLSLNSRETDMGIGVRLATMHRVKGLEFQEMIIAAVNDGILPLASGRKDMGDEVSRKEFDLREKSLLYVAATRAREHLLVTSFGRKSSLLNIV